MRVRAGLFALAALAITGGCGHGDSDNKANVEAPPATVQVATVSRETVPIVQDYEGTLAAVDTVQVRARVQGVLESAPFKEGDLVTKGQLIFQVQQNEYLAALHSAQAQLATGKAQLAAGQAGVRSANGNLYSRQAAKRRADITVARDRPLAAARAIPQKDLDNSIQSAEIAKGDIDVAQAQIGTAQASILSARAAMDSAQAAIDSAQINLGYTSIYAPVTGLIGLLAHSVGNVVGGQGGEVLDTITSIDPIEVTFAMDEPTYIALSRNRTDPNVSALRDQDLRIVLANDKTYEYAGRVYTFNPTVDTKTGTISVVSRFPNPNGLLRPGGFARVRITIERRPNALLVPQTAIIKSQGVDTVYVIDDKNQAALRTVSLGPAYKQSFIVQSGLNAGDRVVVQGTQKVRPGAKVVVQGG